MRDMNCFSCHAINGRGGDMAPDLTWEGSAVQREWLLSFFKNPNTLRPALDPAHAEVQRHRRGSGHSHRLHPDRISDAGVRTGFASQPASDSASIEQGRQLFYSKYACQSCHIVDPQKDKGYVGPTLTQVGDAAERRLDLSSG